MMYRIKQIEEIITHEVPGSHTTIMDSVETTPAPVEHDGDDALIETILGIVREYMKNHIIDYDLNLSDEYIHGYDNNTLAFERDGIFQKYRTEIAFRIDKELDDPHGLCKALKRRLDMMSADDDAVVEYDIWTDTISVIPPSGPWHLINKRYSECSS